MSQCATAAVRLPSPAAAAGRDARDLCSWFALHLDGLEIDHDDDVRECAYDDPQILNTAARGGWTMLSMRDDFACVRPADLADSAR